MPLSWTHEFPSFTASCFQKVFAFLCCHTIYRDLHFTLLPSAIISLSVTSYAGTYPLIAGKVNAGRTVRPLSGRSGIDGTFSPALFADRMHLLRHSPVTACRSPGFCKAAVLSLP